VKELGQVASFIKARVPTGVFTYVNECGHTFNRTEMAGRRKMPDASMDNITCPDGLPTDLDYISADSYGNSSAAFGEVFQVRSLYKRWIYPLLRSHQRVFTVPGFFANATLCKTSHTSHNCECPRRQCPKCLEARAITKQDQQLVTKLHQHLQWAAEDDNIEGMMPWHWNTWPLGSLPAVSQMGARDNPLLVAALNNMSLPLKSDDAITSDGDVRSRSSAPALPPPPSVSAAHVVVAPKTIGWIAGPNGANNRSLAMDAPFLLRDNTDLADRLYPCCQGLYVGFNGYLQRGGDVSCISDMENPPAGCTCTNTTCSGAGCHCDWMKDNLSVASVPPPCGVPPCSSPGGYGDLSDFVDSPSTVKEIMTTYGVHGVKGEVPGVNAFSNMYARREAFTDELVTLAIASNVTGFMMDFEFAAACNWSQWNETMALAATKLHTHGKKLGLFFQSDCGDSQPNAGTNPPCGTLFRDMAYMDKMVDMGTYFLGRPDLPAGITNATQERAQEVALRLRRCPPGGDEYTAYCGLEGQVMNHLFPLPAANETAVPEYPMRAADGQYSVGLWPVNCLNGTLSGGWSNRTLHKFLVFLDTVGVRSIDIFGTGGALPDAGLANGQCSWFLDQLRWWKFNGMGMSVLKTDDQTREFFITVRGEVSVEAASRNGSRLYFPMAQYSMGPLAADRANVIMLRAQTLQDTEGSAKDPDRDAAFSTHDYGASWQYVADEPVQKVMCYSYPVAGDAAAMICIPYSYHPRAVQPARCQAELNAYCNNESLNGKGCIDPQRIQHHRELTPYIALFDAVSQAPCNCWRCFSHQSLDSNLTSWSNSSVVPGAYCSGPASALATIDTQCRGGKPVLATRMASLWTTSPNGTLVNTRRDDISVGFETAKRMHVAGSALLAADGMTLLTPMYEENDGPDYIIMFESAPPHVHWRPRARVTPVHPLNATGIAPPGSGNENWLVRLSDGRLLIVFRGWTGRPGGQLALTASADDGHRWSFRRVLLGTTGSPDPHAVEPKLFLISGVLVLSSGRYGIYLWTVQEKHLQPGNEATAEWCGAPPCGLNLLEHHNANMPSTTAPGAWIYPEGCANGTESCAAITTCYTSMTVVPSVNHSGMLASVVIVYDRADTGWGVPMSNQFDRLFAVRVTIVLKSDDAVMSEDAALTASISQKTNKLVVFYNGWRLLDTCDPSNWGATCIVNNGKCRKMVGLGFNVAVVMIYTPPSALRGLALCGMVPWVAIGNNMHACGAHEGRALRPAPYPECCATVDEPEPSDYRSFCRAHIGSPFLNRSAYLKRVQNATDTLRQSQGWAAGALDDIEQPPWPRRSWSAAGLPRILNFSDLEERLGNRPSASPIEWPSFTDWPTPNAHRLPKGRALTIETVQYNDPQLIATAQPVPTTATTGQYDNSIASILIAGRSTISMVVQPFRLHSNHTRLTRVDLWLKRFTCAFHLCLPPVPSNSSLLTYPAAWLSFSITELNGTDSTPILNKTILCAQRSAPSNGGFAKGMNTYFRSAGLWATCGVLPSEIPVNGSADDWSPTSLYINPAAAALDPSKRYAMVLQFAGKPSKMASSPASFVLGTQASSNRAFDARVYDAHSGQWRTAPGVALRTRLFAPAAAGTDVSRLHENWVAFHAATTARELKEFAVVAKTLRTYNSTGKTMDVVAYSNYAGIGMGPSMQSDYLGDVREAYGVDWSLLAKAGLTVSMCGYGAQDIRPTRAALATGSRAASPPALSVPKLVCSCKSSQAIFTKDFEMCDGAMEFESKGGSTPFNHDFNFRVPNHTGRDSLRHRVTLKTDDPYFPAFHARLHAGHCNDPNGPFVYQGYYHLFMQQNFPWRSDWNEQVGWGHLVSSDLVYWRELPGALVPGRRDWAPVATGGYYSGSATIVNGVPRIAFPAVYQHGACANQYDPSVRNWTQNGQNCSMDYMVSFPANRTDPLLAEWTEPQTIIRPAQGLQPHGWARTDPSQAWLDPASLPEERWIFIGHSNIKLSAGGPAVGVLEAWATENGSNWTGGWRSLGDFFDSGPLGDNDGCCPSFVELQGVSLIYQCDNGYWLGNYSYDRAHPDNQSFVPTTPKKYFDSGGTETSAGKGFFDHRTNRYIFWLWVHGDSDRTLGLNWDSMMSVPREMDVDAYLAQLTFYPIEELDALRTRHAAHGHLEPPRPATLNWLVPLAVNSSQLDIEVTFRWAGTRVPAGLLLGVSFFRGQSEETRAVYNSSSSEVTLDRSRSSLRHVPVPPPNEQTRLGAHVQLKPGETSISLRVLADSSVAEVFAQRGRATATGRAYPTQADSTGAAVFVAGHGEAGVELPSVDFDVWEMGSCRAD
jgi:beta-fructofuranosidase